MKWSLVPDFRCAHLDSKNNFPLKLLFDLPRQPPIRALSLASLGFDLPWAAWNHGALLLWAESSLILWGAMLCRNPLWNCALFSLDNLDWDPVPIKIEETSFSWVERQRNERYQAWPAVWSDRCCLRWKGCFDDWDFIDVFCWAMIFTSKSHQRESKSPN